MIAWLFRLIAEWRERERQQDRKEADDKASFHRLARHWTNRARTDKDRKGSKRWGNR